MKKKMITILTAAFMCATTVIPAFAASGSFSFVDVDSNTYGDVISLTKDSNNSYIGLYISNI